LRNVQINHETGKRDGVLPAKAEPLTHQRHHGVERDHGGFVQVLMEP
jgi:hypothetical protein